MKTKIYLSLLVLILSFSNCLAQNNSIIGLCDAYQSKVHCISKKDYKASTINDRIKLIHLFDVIPKDSLFKYFGEPDSTIKNVDKSIDGVVIFDERIYLFNGLKFVYSLQSESYLLIEIQIENPNKFLSISDALFYPKMEYDKLQEKFSEPPIVRNDIIQVYIASNKNNDLQTINDGHFIKIILNKQEKFISQIEVVKTNM